MIIKSRVLNEVTSKQYTIKFAKSTDEVDEALKLRYDVFKEELGRDFNFEEERDKDEFDDQAHHLIVLDNETDRVVGTYRVQTYEQARQGNGFFSNKRFQLEQFPDHVLRNAVEVGRACVSKDHRNGRVLFLLWKGFAGYLTHFKKRYLFGYSAFETEDLSVLKNAERYLKENGHYHPEYMIDAREGYRFPDHQNENGTDEVDIPPLLQNYLDVGCKVCSRPSYDKNRLSHCIILLDLETISDRTRKLFFG